MDPDISFDKYIETELNAVEQRIEKDYKKAVNHVLRGYLLSRQGVEEEALECFDRALKLDPSCSESYYFRAQLHLDHYRTDEALADIKMAILLKNDKADYYYIKGEILRKAKRPLDAVFAYSHALEIKPAYRACLVERGFLLRHITEGELRVQSQRDLERAEELREEIH